MIRIFLDLENISPKQIIDIKNKDFLYLKNVMRVKISDQINIFNGRDGDFLAEITEINKKYCQITIEKKIKEQYLPPKISLAFSIIKHNALESIAKRGMEMGVTKFFPIITERSFINKFNEEKFLTNIKEGSEQSERNDLAKIKKLQNLEKFLDNLNQDQILILCDESGASQKASKIFDEISYLNQEIIILIGPEGGFSDREFQLIKSKNIYSIALGPRVLRVDTAMIAALSLVQEKFGDWK
jgi:16S rRNA (uracil1498-N3)-methyltransferase